MTRIHVLSSVEGLTESALEVPQESFELFGSLFTSTVNNQKKIESTNQDHFAISNVCKLSCLSLYIFS